MRFTACARIQRVNRIDHAYSKVSVPRVGELVISVFGREQLIGERTNAIVGVATRAEVAPANENTSRQLASAAHTMSLFERWR